MLGTAQSLAGSFSPIGTKKAQVISPYLQLMGSGALTQGCHTRVFSRPDGTTAPVAQRYESVLNNSPQEVMVSPPSWT